jgi:hypothetical protein
MTDKGSSLVKALRQWGLTQFIVLLLVITALLVRGNRLLTDYSNLFVSLVLYCAWAGLLAHARLELTVFRNTKANCDPDKDACGISKRWFYIILVAHLVGLGFFIYYNVDQYLL